MLLERLREKLTETRTVLTYRRARNECNKMLKKKEKIVFKKQI